MFFFTIAIRLSTFGGKGTTLNPNDMKIIYYILVASVCVRLLLFFLHMHSFILHVYHYLFLFHAGWMRTTTSSLMEWTSRTPSSPTLQRTTASLPAFSSLPTARLVLRSTATPRSGRLRRTAGYVAHQDHKLDSGVVYLFWSVVLTLSFKDSI